MVQQVPFVVDLAIELYRRAAMVQPPVQVVHLQDTCVSLTDLHYVPFPFRPQQLVIHQFLANFLTEVELTFQKLMIFVRSSQWVFIS
jgi:hypothetical protein